MTTTRMVSGFYAVATSNQNRDMVLIDALTSKSPLLERCQWSRANRVIAHVYREVDQLEGLDVYDFDGKLPDVKVSFKLGSANLLPIGGRLEVGEDTATLMGGADGFFREQSILLARNAGQKLEKAFFQKIVQTAQEKNRMYSYPNATTGVTIAVVSWAALETCALFSPAFKKHNGDFFELDKYHKGAVYPNREGVNVFGAYVKTTVGLLLADKNAYAVLTNVPTNVEHKDFPKQFAAMMADVIDSANPNEHCTVIMPRAFKTKIASAVSHYGTGNALIRVDDKFEMRICGVPVIGSPNVSMDFKLPDVATEPPPVANSAP